MSLYRNILRQAMAVTWRFKYLWFFGLFAALVSNGSAYNMLVGGFTGSRYGAVGSGAEKIFSWELFNVSTLGNFFKILNEQPLDMLILLFIWLLIAVIACFLIWMICVSHAALINNNALITAGKKHSLKEGLEDGVKKFWPVFGLNFVLKALVFWILSLISLPFLIAAGFLSPTLFNIFSFFHFVVFFGLSFVIYFIINYSIIFAVLKNGKFINSIKLGFKLFIKNWLITLEMGLILFVLNFVAGFIFFLSFIVILVVPFLFVALLAADLLTIAIFWYIAGLALVLFLAALMLIGSIISTFNVSSWTGLFLELIGKGGTSKLVRIFHKNKN